MPVVFRPPFIPPVECSPYSVASVVRLTVHIIGDAEFLHSDRAMLFESVGRRPGEFACVLCGVCGQLIHVQGISHFHIHHKRQKTAHRVPPASGIEVQNRKFKIVSVLFFAAGIWFRDWEAPVSREDDTRRPPFSTGRRVRRSLDDQLETSDVGDRLPVCRSAFSNQEPGHHDSGPGSWRRDQDQPGRRGIQGDAGWRPAHAAEYELRGADRAQYGEKLAGEPLCPAYWNWRQPDRRA